MDKFDSWQKCNHRINSYSFGIGITNSESHLIMSDSLMQWEFEITPLMSAITAVVVFVIGLRVARIIITDGITIKDSTHSWKNTTSCNGVLLLISNWLEFLIR